MSRQSRTRRVSMRQLQMLWEFLDTHRNVAVAYNRSLHEKEYAQRQWKHIAEILNAQDDGVRKTWRDWSKYWVDMKSKLKRRVVTARTLQASTEDGLSSEPPLSEMEQKFLEILGSDFGLPENLPEPVPVETVLLPSTRRWRRKPLMSQEAARRALVKASQTRAEAAVRSSQALERTEKHISTMAECMQRIEGFLYAALARAAE